MSKFRKSLISLAAAGSLVLPLTAMATNGMHAEGTGTKNRGMGGAGIAMANETASISNNPAAVVDVGNRWDVALGVFMPKPRKYSLSGQPADINPMVPGDNNFNGSQESDSNSFLIPFFGMTFPIDSQSAWSVVVNAVGGMNTDYATNFGAKFGLTTRTGVNLEQLFINGTYGRKINNDVTLGVTGIIARQSFEAKGLEAFAGASSDASALSNNGEDTSTGIGIKLGVRVNVGNDMSLGAFFQPKIDMEEFSKYKGLFPDQGDMDIAATYGIGMAWVVSPKLTVAADYTYIDYEGVSAIGNSQKNFTDLGRLFGSSDGPGFGWKSISVIKVGGEYKFSEELTLRAGWNHGENPITSEEVSVNFLAPGVIEDHLTLGGTYNLSKDSELNFAYVKSFENSVTGDFAAAFGGGSMTISMEQQHFEVGYSKHF